RSAVQQCRQLGVQPGIYTGAWWWTGYLNDTHEFSDLPLWAAQGDQVADPGSVTLFGGWTGAVGKQYSYPPSVDLDMFLSEFTQPTIAQLETANPNIRQQLDDWLTERLPNGQDAFDYAAFRQHLIGIGAPDPGAQEFLGFRRPSSAELTANN